MKNVWVLGLFLFSLSAFGATEGMRIRCGVNLEEDGTGPVKMVGEYFIKDGAVRFENSIASDPGQNTIMIGTEKPRKLVVLFPARKVYMEMPDRRVQPAKESAEQNVPFKATGKTKEIAGYSCTVVARDLQGQHEVACTSMKLVKELKSLEKIFPRGDDDRAGMPKGLEGFPLEYQVFNKVEGKVGTTPNMVMKAQELRRENFSASLFEIPTGYQREDFPQMDSKAMDEMMKHSGKGAEKDPKGFEQRMKEMQKMMDETKKRKKAPQ